MAVLEIVDVVVARARARLLDELLGDPAQLLDLSPAHHAGGDEVAVLAIEGDVLLADHGPAPLSVVAGHRRAQIVGQAHDNVNVDLNGPPVQVPRP